MEVDGEVMCKSSGKLPRCPVPPSIPLTCLTCLHISVVSLPAASHVFTIIMSWDILRAWSTCGLPIHPVLGEPGVEQENGAILTICNPPGGPRSVWGG